jgi:hypothetical protein
MRYSVNSKPRKMRRDEIGGGPFTNTPRLAKKVAQRAANKRAKASRKANRGA